MLKSQEGEVTDVKMMPFIDELIYRIKMRPMSLIDTMYIFVAYDGRRDTQERKKSCAKELVIITYFSFIFVSRHAQEPRKS